MNFYPTAQDEATPPEMLKLEPISLDQMRHVLIRLEDTIIFALIERAQFARNPIIYEPNSEALLKLNFDGSFLQYVLRETECVQAKLRRYTSPDENPFTPREALPLPVLPPLAYPQILFPNKINVNAEIYDIYVRHLVPSICNRIPLDDQNYGSSATKDVECLQALSRRIHFGKFIAEAKFSDPREHDDYVRLIKERNAEGIVERLTNKTVEMQVLTRLRRKALTYGQDLNYDEEREQLEVAAVPNLREEKHPQSENKFLNPYELANATVELYEKYVIPLTKKVEVEYLLSRLPVQ